MLGTLPLTPALSPAYRGEGACDRTYDDPMPRLSALLLALLTFVGCRPAADAGPARPRTVLLHFPGIGGELWLDRRFAEALREAGAVDEVQILDWTEGRVEFLVFRDLDENRRQAERIAQRIAQLRRDRPRDRVVLSGHSGGSAIAVWALESLPAGVTVDALVMVAPGLSPTYDLGPALARVDGAAISYASRLDWPVLGAGTRVLGTMDRERVDAAGRVGFLPPAGADPVAYAKLRQVDYDPRWARLGNLGGHMGPTNEKFARKVVAPHVREALTASRTTP